MKEPGKEHVFTSKPGEVSPLFDGKWVIIALLGGKEPRRDLRDPGAGNGVSWSKHVVHVF